MTNDRNFLDSVAEVIEDGIGLIGQALTWFYRFPQLIVPLVASWVIYASVILSVKFDLITFSHSLSWLLIQVFLVYLLLTLSVAMSSLVALEMIQQLGRGSTTNLFYAIQTVFRKNTWQVIPVALIWAALWLTLSTVSAIVSLVSGRPSISENPSSTKSGFELAARTLAGYEEASDREGPWVSLLQKAMRLSVFLILPSLVWGNRRPIDAAKHAYQISHADWGKLASGFVASELVATATSLPLALIFIAVNLFQWNVPEVVWVFVMLYCAGAWSFTLFVEQIFAAELYLWHEQWTEENLDRASRNQPALPLQAFPRPAIAESYFR